MGVMAGGALVLVAALSALLVVIDIGTHRLPDRIVLPGIAGAAVLLAGQALVDADPGRLVWCLAAAAGCTAVLFVLAFINPHGLGLGDVKLGAMLGLPLGWLGWSAVVTGLLAAFVLNGLLILALLLAGRTGRRQEVPFGPSLVLGALVGVLFTWV